MMLRLQSQHSKIMTAGYLRLETTMSGIRNAKCNFRWLLSLISQPIEYLNVYLCNIITKYMTSQAL